MGAQRGSRYYTSTPSLDAALAFRFSSTMMSEDAAGTDAVQAASSSGYPAMMEGGMPMPMGMGDPATMTVKDFHDSMAQRVRQINVSFFAKVGNGKSSSANTLLNAWGYDGPAFEAKRQRGAVTTHL